MAAEEWETVVRRRKGSGRSGSASRPRLKGKQLASSPPEREDSRMEESQVLALRSELELGLSRLRSHCAGLCSRVTQQVMTHDYDGGEHADLICLGIGGFSSSQTALLQLVLALHLKETLLPSQSLIYDPCFTSQESEICRYFGFEVLTENLYGKYEIQRKTVFYMPHCPYRLYCNVLWRNKNRLCDLTIIGNSFLSYSLRRISLDDQDGEDRTDLIRLLGRYFEESEIIDVNDCIRREGILVHMDHAFNDLRYDKCNFSSLQPMNGLCLQCDEGLRRV